MPDHHSYTQMWKKTLSSGGMLHTNSGRTEALNNLRGFVVKHAQPVNLFPRRRGRKREVKVPLDKLLLRWPSLASTDEVRERPDTKVA